MRKVIMFNMITLEGYFEGPNQWDLNWHQVDDEFNRFAIEQLGQSGGIIFGRITYQGMASYWPTENAINDDPQVAAKMNSIPKYVFSRTLDQVEWNNSQLIKGDAAAGLQKLKDQEGKDLLLFGSANLASTFIPHQLIDEYRLMVNPVLIGRGKPLFSQSSGWMMLKLQNTRVFQNGNVLMSYQLANQS